MTDNPMLQGFDQYYRDANRFMELYEGPLDYVIDIGAHVGSLSFLASKKGATKIMAYEPNPYTFKILTKMIKIQKLDGVIVPVQKAVVGNADKKRTLYSPHEVLEQANGVTSLINRWPGRGANIEVDCLKFKSLLKDTIDYLKIDVEGMEYELFDSVTKEDLKVVRFLDLEVHHTPDCDEEEFHTKIKELGFVKDIFPEVIKQHGINAIGRFNENFKE